MRCPTCHGARTVPADQGRPTKSQASRLVCPDCQGTGDDGAGYGDRDVQHPEPKEER